MATDLVKLNAELVSNPGKYSGTSVQNAELLNALDDPGRYREDPVLSENVKRYSMIHGFWARTSRIARFGHEDIPTTEAAVAFVDALDEFESFDLSEQIYLDAVTQYLDALMAVNLISETNKTEILALGRVLISRAQFLDITVGEVSPGDVERALALSV